MSSSDFPSTLSLLDVELPVKVTLLVFMQQVFWAMGYMCLLFSTVHKGRYVGMPFAALVLTFGYDFAFGMIWVEQLGWEAQGHRGWLLLNGCIFYIYTTKEFFVTDDKGHSKVLGTKMAHSALFSVSIWTLMSAFVLEMNDFGGLYTSFLVRFIASLLTMQQIITSTETPELWETIVPGVCRLLSTALASAAFAKLMDHSTLLSVLYVGCFIWDLAYVTTATYRYRSAPPKEKAE